ncbi:hypothetical protein [Nocardioides litoris]|uniref:hypothetical protein n=1 Tax=Nocardioides litoris TaxID=1926648 RepID=UPI0014775669|nr:hypothetical protein [Nocardioides litoris]
MSELDPEDTATEADREEQQQEIAEVQEQLDGDSDGEGLGNEAGRGEETGISEG